MTINTTTARASFSCNGSTQDFAFSQLFTLSSDLVVLLVDNATQVATLLVLNTDYTVTGAGNPAGGNVHTVAAYAAGKTIVIYRDPPLTQLLDLVQNDTFPPNSVETAYDKLTMICQRLKDLVTRSFRLADGDTSGAAVTIPGPSALKFLRWNSAATAIENADIASTGTVLGVPIPVSQGGTGATDAATARTNLAAVGSVSPTFTGTTAVADLTISGTGQGTTQATGDNTTKLATDAFVQTELVTGANNAKVPVRQTVLGGAVDSSGLPSWLAAGAGLAINLSATAKAVTLAFANGFNAAGDVDLCAQLTADATNQFGAIPANSLSYLYADRASASAITGANTLIPCQYADIFDRSRQALLQFQGTNASTLSSGNWTGGNQPGDDYGNTWTTNGNAKLDTSQFKFGTSSLLLDGTTDFLECTPATGWQFTTAPNGGWTVEGFFRWGTLPTAGQTQILLNFGQSATNFGILFGLNNTAATIKSTVSLSSNGTSADIASVTLGAATAWVINTWYHLAVTYDPVAGKYFVYKDGVLDTTVTSGNGVCQPFKGRIGESIDATLQQFNGWVGAFRTSSGCRYPNGTTFTPSVSAFIADGHFFSIPEMKMYEVTGACASAGSDPAMTNRPNRVFVGECQAAAATISSATSYAYRGRYITPWTPQMAAAGTLVTVSHNIGDKPLMNMAVEVNGTNIGGYQPGDRINNPTVWDASRGYSSGTVTHLVGTFNPGTTAILHSIKSTGGAGQFPTTFLKYRFEFNRRW